MPRIAQDIWNMQSETYRNRAETERIRINNKTRAMQNIANLFEKRQQGRITAQEADFGAATLPAKTEEYFAGLERTRKEFLREGVTAKDVHITAEDTQAKATYEQEQRALPYDKRDTYLAAIGKEKAEQESMLARQKTIEAQKIEGRVELEGERQKGKERVLNMKQDFTSIMTDVKQGHRIDVEVLKADQTLTRDEKQQIWKASQAELDREFDRAFLESKQGFEEKMLGIRNDNTLNVLDKKASLQLSRDEVLNAFDVKKYEYQAAQQSYRQNMGSIYDAQLFDLKNRAREMAAETEQGYTLDQIREEEAIDQRMESRREQFKEQVLTQKLDAQKSLMEYRLDRKEDEWKAKLKGDLKTELKAADHNAARVQLDTLFNKLKGEFGNWANVNVRPGYNTAVEVMGKIKESIVKNNEPFDPQIVASEAFNETLRAYIKADLILNSAPQEGETESDRLIRITGQPELVKKARSNKLAVLNTMISIAGLNSINFEEPRKTIRAMLTLN